MTVISYNTTQVRQLRDVVNQRVGDINNARDRIRHVRNALDVDTSDPNVSGLHQRLDHLQRNLDTITNDLRHHHATTNRFLTQAALINRPLPRLFPGVLRNFPFRFGPFSGRPRPSHPLIAAAIGQLGRITTLPRLRAPTMRLFTRSRRFATRSINTVRHRASNNFNRYVRDPLRATGKFVVRQWRRVTDFVQAWNAAWANYASVISGLRAVADYVLVTATVRFPSVERDPRAVVEEEIHFDAALTVNIPLKGVAELRFETTLTAEVVFYNDNTVEITIGSEFAAELAAKLALEFGGDGSKIEATIMAAIGDEQTYRIRNGMIGNRRAHVVFLEQMAARFTLRTMVETGLGGPGTTVAAWAALKLMGPTPEPISSSGYIRVGGVIDIDIDLDFSGFGASGKLATELKGQITRTEAGTTLYEISAEVEMEHSVTRGGSSAGRSITGTATFRVEADSQGRVIGIEFEREIATEVSGGSKLSAGPGSLEGTVGEVRKETITERFDVDASMRSRLDDLVRRLPGSGAELAAEIARFSGTGVVTVENSGYDYVRSEVGIDGKVVEVEGSLEHRTPTNRDSARGGGW